METRAVDLRIRALRLETCRIRAKMEIVKIMAQIQLLSTHVKNEKRGTKAKENLSPILEKKEIDIWLNKIRPKTPLGVFPFESNWVL